MPRKGVCHSQTERGKMKIISSKLFPLLLLLMQVCVCFTGANLTASLDRIKIVFTPMRCRRVCSGNRCYNSCEKGDVTTVYSETSQQQPPKTQGFRLCEYQLWSLRLSLPFWTAYHPLVLCSQYRSHLCPDSHTLNFFFHPTFPFLFYWVSLTKKFPSGMLSVVNAKPRVETEWCRWKNESFSKNSLSLRSRNGVA